MKNIKTILLYRKQNDGILHEKVIIKSWYSFVLSEFIKPYQCLLNLKEKFYKKDLDFNVPENFVSSIAFYSDEPPRWFGQRHIQYYINSAGDVYPDRTSELACLCNLHADGKAISRIVFVVDDFKGSSHFKSTKIKFGEFEVDAFKFCHE